jgi:hypothetical protein
MCHRRKRARLTGHADASEGSRIVEAASLVLARMTLAFVDVRLASRSGEALGAIARERTRCVDAYTVVLAGGT